MTLGDTLAQDAPEQARRSQALDTASPSRASPEQQALSQISTAVDAEFGHMYGSNAAEARAAVASAVAAEGPTAYDRLKTEPEAFGTVTGDRAQAARLGGTLEALDYAQSAHTAQQEGRAPVVPGYGDVTRDVAVPERTEARDIRDPGDVERAVQVVRERLGGGVSHEDLEDIQRTLLALTPAEASDAFGQLRPEELQEWGRELADSGRWLAYRGYDDGERGVLFDRLAEHLDGAQLARFGQALDATASTDDNRRLGAAVGGHSLPEAQVDFVRGLITDRMDSTFSQGDAVAVAMTVRGMGRDGAQVGEALRGVESEQLERVVAAGIETEQGPRGVTYNAEVAMQVLHGVVSAGDAGLTTEAFVGASAALERRRPPFLGGGAGAELQTRSWNAAERQVQEGMTALLDSSTNDVVQNLRVHHRSGEPLTRYAEGLIESGDIGTLGRHIARLQRGDNLDERPADRFGRNAPGASVGDHETNASRLGYAVGAVSAAFQNRAGYLQDDVDRLATLIGYVAPGKAVTVGKIGLNAIVGARGDRLDGIRAEFEEGAFPDDEAGQPYGNEVLDAYENSKDRIINQSSNR